MQIFETDKKSVMLGSGYLYAIESSKYEDGKTKTNDMDEIGYILNDATFTRSKDTKEVHTANYGTVVMFDNNHKAEFKTGIISYDPEMVSKYMTGSEIEKKDGTIRTYFSSDDQSPMVALVFAGKDKDSGREFNLVMPKCHFIGDYELKFDEDDPIELDFHFRCLDTEINGKNVHAWIDETTPNDTTGTEG